MLRVGINCLFLRKSNTGIGRVTRSLLEEIAKIDRENSYFLYLDQRANIAFPPNFRSKVIFSHFYKREDLVKQTFWEKITIAREAEKDRLDVFFTPYNSATRLKGIPHLVLLHDVIWKVLAGTYLYNFRRRIYAGQTFEAVKSAKRILTVSEFSRKEIQKHLGIDPRCIRVIGGGVSDVFRPLEKNDRQVKKTLEKFGIKKPYIFYVGGFEIRKNVPFLLRAFSKLTKHYESNLQDRILVIGGETPSWKHPLLDDVRAIANNLKMDERIKFVGPLSDEELVSFYNGADFFVFPSLYEGFGLTVLEAMACGTPVIASQIGSIQEVAGQAVYYFHPEREDELIQSMNRFLTDAVLKEELRVKALNRAKEFSWEKPALILLEEIKSNSSR